MNTILRTFADTSNFPIIQAVLAHLFVFTYFSIIQNFKMFLMGMSAIFIYATPLFLVMHGCLDDVYGAEEIVLLISLVIGIICTITGFLKYKVKEAV